MGYESKLYIIDRREITPPISNKIWVCPIQIADIDMSKMCYADGWIELFTTPTDYKIYIDGDTETDTDCYGDKIKYASIESVIAWLENRIRSGDNYRRLPILLGLLKGIDPKQWENIQIVHYGH